MGIIWTNSGYMVTNAKIHDLFISILRTYMAWCVLFHEQDAFSTFSTLAGGSHSGHGHRFLDQRGTEYGSELTTRCGACMSPRRSEEEIFVTQRYLLILNDFGVGSVHTWT